MRLIDADALIEEVDGALTDSIAEGYAIEKIMDAPTINAVSVVRCKDCRYWGAYPSSSATPWLHECYARIARLHTAADEFCSRAERREVSETDG